MKLDPETGIIIGVYTNSNESSTFLATLNPTNGAVTQIGPTEPTLDAIAFFEASAPIPTLTEYGMMATAILLLLGALVLLKRRQVKFNA